MLILSTLRLRGDFFGTNKLSSLINKIPPVIFIGFYNLLHSDAISTKIIALVPTSVFTTIKLHIILLTIDNLTME